MADHRPTGAILSCQKGGKSLQDMQYNEPVFSGLEHYKDRKHCKFKNQKSGVPTVSRFTKRENGQDLVYLSYTQFSSAKTLKLPHSAFPISVAYQGSKFNAQHLCCIAVEAKCWVMSHWLVICRNQNIMCTKWNLHLHHSKQTQSSQQTKSQLPQENVNQANPFLLVSYVVVCCISDLVLQRQLPESIFHYSGKKLALPALLLQRW